MALTPAQLAELQRLRQMFVPLAEQAKRDSQRQDNMDKMNPQNKAKGGLTAFMKGTKAKERVYHGTGNLEGLASFDPTMTGKGNDQLGSGFYFTTHPDEASGYATSVTPNVSEGTEKLGGNSSPGVVAAHLAIRKPIKVGPKGSSLNDANVNLSHDQVKRIMEHVPNLRHPDESPLNDHFDTSRGVTPKMIHDVSKLYTGKGTLHMLENDMFRGEPTKYRHALHNVLGYDGVMKDFGDGRKHYVAWFPEQVKSAIGNRGTYDPTNPDITMAEGGQPSMDEMRLAINKHGMYSPLEKSLMAVPRSKGTPAEFMAEAGKQPGFRAEEVADRRVQLPQQKMSKAEMLAHLQKHPSPQLEERILSRKNVDPEVNELAHEMIRNEINERLDQRRFSSQDHREEEYDRMYQNMYRPDLSEYHLEAARQLGKPSTVPNYDSEDLILPGGKNYREILLKLPTSQRKHTWEWYDPISGESEQGFGSQSEAYAARPSAGAVVSKVESKDSPQEYQSSHWDDPNVLAHIRASDRTGPNGEKILHIEEIQSDWHNAGRKSGYKGNPSKEAVEAGRQQAQKMGYSEDQINAMSPEQLSHFTAAGSQSVPDAPFKKSWHELALKHMLNKAAKEGYHGIAITPGREQADRYNLAKYITSINATPVDDGEGYIMKIVDKKGKTIANHRYEADELEKHVGKDMAKKIVSQGGGNFEGLDLQVGGEGKTKFYDQIVPTFLNKLGKPHGAQVGKVPLGNLPPLPRDAEPEDVQSREKMAATQLHYFPITDSLRNQINEQGLPQYERGGIIHKAEGGSMQPTLAQMKAQLGGRANPIDIRSIGVNEAVNLDPKVYMPPNPGDGMPAPGGVATPSGMPVGGIDVNQGQPGKQLMPQSGLQPQGGPQQPPGAPGASGAPAGGLPGGAPQGMPGAGGQPPMGPASNILQMTPQGQTMAALGGGQPPAPPMPKMAKGGSTNSAQKYQELLRRHLNNERLSKEQNMLLGLYGSVGGGRKLRVPTHMMSATHAPDPNQPMVPEKIITPEDLYKGAGVPLVGDSSRGGELLTHIDNKKLRKPVELQGGKNFMRLIKPAGEESGWASAPHVISDLANKTRLASEFGDKVYGLHATMTGTGADFSSMPTKAVLQMLDRKKIKPEAMDAFDAEMRSIFPKFKGIRSPALAKQLLAPGAANMRKTFLQRMNTDPYQDAGFPDVAHARVAVSHPELLDRPVHSIGAGISELDPTGRVIKSPSKPHYDYPAELAQKGYAGAFEVPMNRGEIFQEWEKNRRMFNASPSSDPRSFDLSTPVQKFDQEWLDKVMPIYLARRKAILGKKKGGKVNMDAMRLELTKGKK